MSRHPVKVAIVGNGAIGNLLAYQSEKNGFGYQLLTRNGAPISLSCTDFEGKTVTLQPEVQAVDSKSDADIILLPLKAYQIEPAIKQLLPNLTPQQTIVLMNNGMGTSDLARQLLPDHSIAVATTTYGAFKPTANSCQLTGYGRTQAGWVQQSDSASEQYLQPLLAKLLAPCDWPQDMNLALWQKLSVNAVINPLTALYQVRNGELLKPQYDNEISQLCEEISQVMLAEGVKQSASEIKARAQDVMHKTAQNYSSMNRDVFFKRRTEIDFINGFITQVGNKHNIDAVVNGAFVKKIYQLYLQKLE